MVCVHSIETRPRLPLADHEAAGGCPVREGGQGAPQLREEPGLEVRAGDVEEVPRRWAPPPKLVLEARREEPRSSMFAPM